jgi:hypothetical protein
MIAEPRKGGTEPGLSAGFPILNGFPDFAMNLFNPGVPGEFSIRHFRER